MRIRVSYRTFWAAFLPWLWLGAAVAAEVPQGQELTEVTVTANRREESNQRVPMAITAITADTADKVGVTDAESLAGLVPGLNFNRQTVDSVPFLRGVGAPAGQAGDEPSVALYVDDVYMPSGSASIANFNSIARVEVERGPQSTLFGRNATGGVVQIFTRDPTDKPELETRFGYGNYDTWSANTYASGPLAPGLLANIAAYWSDQREGWGRNTTTGLPTFKSHDYGGRIKFLATPADSTSVLLNLDFDQTVTDQGIGFKPWSGTGSLDPLPPFPNGGFLPAPGYYDLRESLPSDGQDRQLGASLKVSQELPWFRLVSISAYRDTHVDYQLDQDVGPLPLVDVVITSPERTYTQEFRLLSEHGALSWIAGLFYFNDEAGYDPLHLAGSAFTPLPYVDEYGIQKTRSWAGFAQATATILPKTHFTAGIRYTVDNRSLRAGATFGNATLVPSSNSRQSKSWSSPTWRLVLDHQLTPDALVYLGYNRGFKSGLFNAVVNAGAPIDTPVNPETLDAYTTGFKSEWLHHRLRLNAEAFYYDYRNIQVEEIVTGATHFMNAARATIKGVDLDFGVIPLEGLTLTGGIEVLQGHYDSFPDGTFYVYNPATGGNCPFVLAAPPAPIPCGGAVVPPHYNPATGQWDLKGNRTIQSPPFSASVTALYERPSAIGAFDVALSWTHTGNYFIAPDNGMGQIAPSSSQNTMQPRIDLLNGSLGWKSLSSQWEVKLWAKNITAVRYWSEADLQAFATQYSPAPPRTYGVTITNRFY